MSGKTLQDHVIPTREYISLTLRRGETLRVIDFEGKQVADLVALNSADKGEKLSCVYSNMINGTWKLTRGHTIYTNRANPIFSITEDRGFPFFLGEDVNSCEEVISGRSKGERQKRWFGTTAVWPNRIDRETGGNSRFRRRR